ncbi:MAG: division/cell wall cluster transcriptional repressor MraZ [Dehalococcoidia bacterium]|nr:division/cell wall cluster transcriptional repressor MraZ [Dehalococcoidia bacterium]|tara:strand:- start:1717 stop:2169 length:453 start_codon:yes stop_codon:yes gene_type:complete
MAFRGNFEYQLDDRNRVTLPPKFREDFAKGAVLVPGLDGCIEVYTPEGFETEAGVVERVPAYSEEGRQLRRAFFALSFDVQRDGQGRLLIPAKLLAYASIERDVVVLGNDQRLEIWDRTAWEEQESLLPTARADALQRLADGAASEGEGG